MIKLTPDELGDIVCPSCDGTGYVDVCTSQSTAACPICQTSGYLHPDDEEDVERAADFGYLI